MPKFSKLDGRKRGISADLLSNLGIFTWQYHIVEQFPNCLKMLDIFKMYFLNA